MKIITVGYLLTMVLVMLNMLIAKMGSTYDRITERSELEWLLERARMLLVIEHEMSPEELERMHDLYWVKDRTGVYEFHGVQVISRDGGGVPQQPQAREADPQESDDDASSPPVSPRGPHDKRPSVDVPITKSSSVRRRRSRPAADDAGPASGSIDLEEYDFRWVEEQTLPSLGRVSSVRFAPRTAAETQTPTGHSADTSRSDPCPAPVA